MQSETIEEKRKRLLAAMQAKQGESQQASQKQPEAEGPAPSADDPRLSMVKELMERMNANDGRPIIDSTGLWDSEEIFPKGKQGESVKKDASADSDEDAEIADDAGSEDIQSEEASPETKTDEDEEEPASGETDQQNQSKDGSADDSNPYAALLKMLFPHMDPNAFGDPANTFAQLFPHLQGGMGDFQNLFDLSGFQQLFQSIPGMSQLLRILKEGPGEDIPRDKEARHSPLVTIREGGDKTPFFCVHAILGSTFHYHRLAALLDPEQPFYALQAQGLDPREEPLDNLEDFAERYSKEIRKVQPYGPYKIGGYSFGSWVAFEIAQRLVASGEEVELLVLIGAGLPISMSAPALCANSNFAQKYFNDFRKMLMEPFLTYEERMNGGFDGLIDRYLTPLQRLYRSHCQAIMTYVPQAYPGRFVLMETIEQRAVDAAIALGGWDRLAHGGVESLLISGNHLSMLEEPHINEVAQHLDYYIKNPPGR